MLRIDDVESKTFTTTRLREGYEIAEVDAFRLDVVDAIGLRDKVISELQEELAEERVRAEEAEAASLQVEAPVAPAEEATTGDRRQQSAAALRLLEVATVNADQLVAEAQAEAESLVSAARAEAEALLATSRAEADELLATSRTEAEELTATASAEAERVAAELERHRDRETTELEQHRSAVLRELEEKKAALEARIATLDHQESEHREHLRKHYAAQLAQLEDPTPTPLRAVSAD